VIQGIKSGFIAVGKSSHQQSVKVTAQALTLPTKAKTTAQFRHPLWTALATLFRPEATTSLLTTAPHPPSPPKFKWRSRRGE